MFSIRNNKKPLIEFMDVTSCPQQELCKFKLLGLLELVEANITLEDLDRVDVKYETIN